MFTLEDVLKAMDSINNVGANRPALRENCMKKLTSLSRFVTPCPDILDGEGSSNNNTISNNDRSSTPQMNAKPERINNQSSGQSSDFCPYPECSELSDSSDESAWESVPTPTHLGGQWKNLLEYEASLQANKDRQSMNHALQSQDQKNLSFSSSVPHQKTTTKQEIFLQQDDFVEILKSIAKSLRTLQATSSGSTSDRFGQYISQRLSELSEQNRTEAEIEINKVLMKYLAKDLNAESSSPPPNMDTSENRGKNRQIKGKKNTK